MPVAKPSELVPSRSGGRALKGFVDHLGRCPLAAAVIATSGVITGARLFFRRLCFNALISNTDDHLRNHAIAAKERSWKLAPAYDLTPSVPVSAEHRDLAFACGDMVRGGAFVYPGFSL